MRKKKNLSDIVPIYSPRTSYKKIKSMDEKMIADMTLNFDKLTINLLKEEFELRDNELTLQEFIVIAKKHLKFWQNDIANREISLMRYLTFLFNEIDINGNGDMEWDEFTNYIIEKATVLKNLKSKADEVKHYVKSKVKPKMKMDGIIQKCEYIEDLEKIAFYEEGSNRIAFMSLETGEISQKVINIDPKKLVVNISSVKKEKNGKVSIRKKDLVLPTEVRVLDMIYLPEKKYKVLLVSTSDGYIRGWKYSQNGFYLANQPDNEEEVFQHFFSSEIFCMAWDTINQVLYCGQKNGNIYMWNLKTDLEKPLCENKTPSGDKENGEEKVSNMITCMITMPKLQFMASGRMDGKLILWDTINNKKKWTYNEHTRGIVSLSFNQTMILLFSAGFDHKICIWNPYISTLIHRIEGHLAPILSLKVIEGTNQLISMDSEGIVKITDTRRFNFIYSFSVESSDDNSSSLTSLLVISKPLKLVFGGKSIYIYEYDKNYHPYTADENTTVCCKYIKSNLCFFTPTGNKIKVWSSLNGDVERIYMDITTNEISAFQFDFLKKRMVVGDTKGNITLHNTANGAKMKTLSKHAAQITHLIATQNETAVDIFISCGLDNEIRIFKQTEESYEIIRTIYIIKEAAITCLDYCSETKLIIVGSNVGTLAFYDIETGKTAGTCLNKSFEEFTSICKTRKSMIIASASSGKVSIIAMPPLPNRFQKIFSFYHEDYEKPGSPLGVRTISYSPDLHLLFAVDDKMYLTCYDFQEIEERNEKSLKVDEKVESVRRQIHTKIFQEAKVKVIWQVKAHLEVVKSMEFIAEENIIVTTSFDKKVKLWNAKTGEFLDSLQQNYNKAEVNPIAYYNTKSSTLYSSDLKNSKQVPEVDPVKVQFDPFAFESILQEDPNFSTMQHSNTEWNINVHFKDIALEEIQRFQNLAQSIKEFDAQCVEVKNKNKTMLSEIKRKFEKQKAMLKVMLEENKEGQDGDKATETKNSGRNQNYDFVRSEDVKENQLFPGLEKQENRRLSKCYFRRSAMKSIENLKNKKDNQIMTENICKKTQRDFVPISQLIKNREKSRQDIQGHQKYIENLYKQPTQSFLNSKVDKTSWSVKFDSDKIKSVYDMLNHLDDPTNNLYSTRIPHKTTSSSETMDSKNRRKGSLPKIG